MHHFCVVLLTRVSSCLTSFFPLVTLVIFFLSANLSTGLHQGSSLDPFLFYSDTYFHVFKNILCTGDSQHYIISSGHFSGSKIQTSKYLWGTFMTINNRHLKLNMVKAQLLIFLPNWLLLLSQQLLPSTMTFLRKNNISK